MNPSFPSSPYPLTLGSRASPFCLCAFAFLDSSCKGNHMTCGLSRLSPSCCHIRLAPDPEHKCSLASSVSLQEVNWGLIGRNLKLITNFLGCLKLEVEIGLVYPGHPQRIQLYCTDCLPTARLTLSPPLPPLRGRGRWRRSQSPRPRGHPS